MKDDVVIEREFSFKGNKYQVRAMDIPIGIIAKAFGEDDRPASAPYIIPREIAADVLRVKLSPSPAALMHKLMDIIQGDIESGMGMEMARASAALNGRWIACTRYRAL